MAKVTPITEHFQHFVSELKESFWGDLQGQVQQSMRRLFSSCCRSGNATCTWSAHGTAGRSRARTTATATTSAILSPALGRCGCALRALASGAFCPGCCRSFSAGLKRCRCSSEKRFCAASARGRWDGWWRSSRASR